MLNINPLSGFAPRTEVHGWAYIQTAVIRTASNNNPYLAWSAYDINGNSVTGTLYGKNGTTPQVFNHGDVVAVFGAVGESRGSIQIWATVMTPVMNVEEATEFKNRCLPSVPADELTFYINDLKQLAMSISDPALKTLSGHMWDYMEPYLRTAPAAKKNHEPVRGGLAKHTWQVVYMARSALNIVPGADADVTLFCALYHDLGKVREYTEDMNFTPEGRLVSHAIITLELLAQLSAKLETPVDPTRMAHIRHGISAHHGQYGGEVKPVTREALIVHHADYMVSTIGHITEIMRQGAVDEYGWSNQFSSVLGSQAWIPQMAKKGL